MAIRWKVFRAAAAEQITGMDAETQRVKRRRGQIAPVDEGVKARLTGPLLAEMLMIHELSPYNVVTKVANETVRSVASGLIAYWALVSSGTKPKAAANLVWIPGGRRQPPATHMIAHHTDTHWRDTKFTADPARELADQENSIALVVDLRAMGQRLAQRAGDLVEEGE